MRLKWIMLITAIFMIFLTGCGKESNIAAQPTAAAISEKYTVVTDSDLAGTYTLPVFRNMNDEAVQTLINDEIVSCITESKVKVRKEKAEELLSKTDLSEYDFREFGTYKVYCNDGKYLSFYLSVEQRFTKEDNTEFIKQNYIYNYDTATGNLMDFSTLFQDKEKTSEYIAQKLYERLLNMDCLQSGEYSDDIFKDDVFKFCVIVSENKIAVVTTAGKFDLKPSAGAPTIEISIPEEYYLKSK